MSLETIRAAIVDKLDSIPGIGRVHSYERFASTNAKFVELYATGGQIRGWHVRRVATTQTSYAVGRWQTVHVWEVRGYVSLSDADASEIALDALVESIRAAFHADDSLGGVVDTCERPDSAGVQLVDSGPVMFAGVLCHGVRLKLYTVVI